MAKKTDKERRKQQEQAQWERENKQLREIRSNVLEKKAALKAKGCFLPFYDFLDSYEDEFKKVVAWARTEFRSLHDVFELLPDEMDNDWKRLGLPGDWQQIFFKCDDEHAASYNDDDPNANLRGGAVGFLDFNNNLHTIIQVIKNPQFGKKHKEHKYAFKIPILFHEVGHVKDYEEKINFNHETKTADLIEAEVFAHLFALKECYQRAYYISGDSWLASLMKHKDHTDYRGEVVRRVIERFEKPAFMPWLDFDI